MDSFTKKFTDNSIDSGFQFSFYCDLCEGIYKTQFVESKSNKKAGFMRGLAKVASFGADIGSNYVKDYRLSSSISKGAAEISQKFSGMSSDWQQEHLRALDLAEQEAKQQFRHCTKCRKWVCKDDWNEKDGMCLDNTAHGSVSSPDVKATNQANTSAVASGSDDLVKLLKMRLAKGEITLEEFTKLKAAMET